MLKVSLLIYVLTNFLPKLKSWNMVVPDGWKVFITARLSCRPIWHIVVYRTCFPSWGIGAQQTSVTLWVWRITGYRDGLACILKETCCDVRTRSFISTSCILWAHRPFIDHRQSISSWSGPTHIDITCSIFSLDEGHGAGNKYSERTGLNLSTELFSRSERKCCLDNPVNGRLNTSRNKFDLLLHVSLILPGLDTLDISSDTSFCRFSSAAFVFSESFV